MITARVVIQSQAGSQGKGEVMWIQRGKTNLEELQAQVLGTF